MTKEQLTRLYDQSFKNKEACNKAFVCGCFFCLAIFSPTEIKEWHEEKRVGGGFTAICPKCGIDSILAESKEIKITAELLKEMHEEAFTEKTSSGVLCFAN
jgi:hypothetical protein